MLQLAVLVVVVEESHRKSAHTYTVVRTNIQHFCFYFSLDFFFLSLSVKPDLSRVTQLFTYRHTHTLASSCTVFTLFLPFFAVTFAATFFVLSHVTLVPVRWPPSPQGFSVKRPLTILHEQTKKKTDHDHESSSRDRARERAESTELRAAPRSKLHTSRPNEQPCAPSIADRKSVV